MFPRPAAPRSSLVAVTATLALALVSACSSNSTPTESHEPLPQLVYQGGEILTAPKLVTVTFPGDVNAAALQAFDDSVTTSAWWDTIRAGYCEPKGNVCVGRGTSGGHVEMTAAPSASYSDATDGSASTLQDFIATQVNTGVFPAPDANTIYVIYMPVSTKITLAQSPEQPVQTSCEEFGGYHNSLTIQGQAVAYAVVPECPPTDGTNLSQLGTLTFAASHEIVEAATDPVQSGSTLGFYLDLDDDTVAGWNLLEGGEAADMCVDVTGLNQDQTTEEGYTVQRIWSNANAAAGDDPCVPAPAGDIYFNVAPSGTDSFIVLDVGESTTFDAFAFASAPTASWTVGGLDWYSAQQQAAAPLLTFTFNGQKTVTANSGDKIQVTVTLNADPGQLGGAEGLMVSLAGSPNAPTAAHVWPILVVTPSEAAGGP